VKYFIRVGIECRNNETKESTLVNHNRHKQQQSELEANTCNRRQTRENTCLQVIIGFTSDWPKKWREFFQPITDLERGKATPKQTQIAFDTQLKTALK